ncbi:MAG TPA: efflux RND transporter periplasmic adaptor subunit [Hyphomicrobiaceae bacterium]|nr:efflux RND transporter periplasmic adaptor subunit [Hyphomicrobiaceae bacterium]
MLRRGLSTVLLLVGAAVVAGGALYGATRYVRETSLLSATAPDRGKADPKARTKGKAGAAVAVEAVKAIGSKTTVDIKAIGSLRSDESVQIAAEISGRIQSINFAEGGDVKAGEVLVKLDDSLAEAEVADAKARFDLAEANNQRAKRLSRTGSVTEKAVDEATTTLEIARAAVELQRVKLARHVITAPFAGRVGIRKASPGGFISAGTAIVNLEKIDVLKVDFKLPEVFLAAVGVGQVVEIQVDALPGRSFAGEIYAIDPQVDVNGRAMALRARIANPELVLRPGLFARILVKGKDVRDAVRVPEAAIVSRGGETYVFRIDANIVSEVKVRLGERRGADVEILEGLSANQLVVSAGQMKLRNGLPVEIVAPASEPATTPSRKSPG